jgi:hypothetical protein
MLEVNDWVMVIAPASQDVYFGWGSIETGSIGQIVAAYHNKVHCSNNVHGYQIVIDFMDGENCYWNALSTEVCRFIHNKSELAPIRLAHRNAIKTAAMDLIAGKRKAQGDERAERDYLISLIQLGRQANE